MKAKEQIEICRAAIEKYGYEKQKEKCIEECAELINAIQKYRIGRNVMTDVITEIADVTIMCRQMAMAFGIDEVEAEIDYKLERLKERISNE